MTFDLSSSAVHALLTSQSRLDRLMPTLLDIVLDLTHAERGFLMLYDDGGNLTIRAARTNQKQDLPHDQFQGSNSIVEKVVTDKKPLYVPLLPLDKKFAAAQSVKAGNLQSVICIPLWNHPQNSSLSGILYIDSSSPKQGPLREEDLALVEGLANHVAVSIQNACLFEELKQKNREIASLNEKLQIRVDQQEGKLSEMQVLLEDTQRELGKRYGLGILIGKSPAMQKVFRVLEKVTGTSATVLIEGESGTGKELAAKYIHYNGARANKPMLSINCAAFNDTLLEGELFGHRKGAFTGADQNKIGLFQAADGGTLLLDEIGDMSVEMQKKLLRVLQNGEVRPVGSKDVFHVDVRIIAATNHNLKELTQHGTFREDLYFRLNVIQIQMPPLRERREDIPLLVDFYSNTISAELKRPNQQIPDRILGKFLEYQWPGNVRELENELRKIFILGSEYSFERFEPVKEATSLNLATLEENAIRKALESSGGNKTRAAELLGLPLRTLYERLKRHAID